MVEAIATISLPKQKKKIWLLITVNKSSTSRSFMIARSLRIGRSPNITSSPIQTLWTCTRILDWEFPKDIIFWMIPQEFKLSKNSYRREPVKSTKALPKTKMPSLTEVTMSQLPSPKDMYPKMIWMKKAITMLENYQTLLMMGRLETKDMAFNKLATAMLLITTMANRKCMESRLSRIWVWQAYIDCI